MRPADGLSGPPARFNKLLNVHLRGEEREASELIVEVSLIFRISMFLRVQGPDRAAPSRRGGPEQRGVLPAAAVREKARSQETLIGSPEILDQSANTLAALENNRDEIVRRMKNRDQFVVFELFHHRQGLRNNRM